MMVRLPRRTPDRKWIYTSAATAQEEAGIFAMEEYIRRCQNTVAQYIAAISLLDLCERSDRAPGARVVISWWEKEGIDLARAWEAAGAAAENGGGEE